MLTNQMTCFCSRILLTLSLGFGLAGVSGFAQSAPAKDQSVPAKDQPAATQPAKPDAAATAPHSTSRYRPTGMPPRARNYYEMLWGVDSFGTKVVESGEMVRFSYRVLDADKAAQLNDKHNQPALIDERAGVKLSVPTLEKVGALRQSTTPEAGKIYWMVFSNKERYVKRGDRVSVVIGKFRVDNLLVE
ncbi:MAG TPA: hypothetical protein VFA40_11895 [Terriglobales bacterium]|jgi:hypothetical protein|nr:hypothetical protein [Terriglobales bacterium]